VYALAAMATLAPIAWHALAKNLKKQAKAVVPPPAAPEPKPAEMDPDTGKITPAQPGNEPEAKAETTPPPSPPSKPPAPAVQPRPKPLFRPRRGFVQRWR
jgi:hypothetical protein